MSWNLRKKARTFSYCEPEEPDLDEYIFCSKCKDYVYEYCSIHGRLLIVPDDKVPAVTNYPSYVPRSALTIPHVFLHLARSYIPGAGLGVFSTLTLPAGVRFGPYRGVRTQDIDSQYCWQIYDNNRRPSHVIDARDPNKSNWMRFVNCSRYWDEQNLLAFQYRGEIYYKTLKIIPRHTELLVYYGSAFANKLGIDIRRYNAPKQYHLRMGDPVTKSNNAKAIEDVSPEEDPGKTDKVDENVAKTDKVDKTVGKTDKVDETVAKTDKFDETVAKTDKVDETVAKKSVSNKKLNDDNDERPLQKKINLNKFKMPDETQSNASKFTCDHCQTNFNTKLKLQWHIMYVNGKDSQSDLTCKKCNYKCDTVQEFEKHARFHDEKRRFKCDVCNCAFNQNIHLKTHMRIHTGDKPYKCDVCNCAFSRSSTLERHMRIHTGDKPYKCDVCNYASSDSSAMKTHMRIHTGDKPYKCDVCNCAFSRSSTLKTHMRIHTGDKPYKCDVCNYASSDNSNLKKHMRIHTGNKPNKK